MTLDRFDIPNLHGEWRLRKDDGRGQPSILNTCSYCGSIPPGFFLKACENNYKITGADWQWKNINALVQRIRYE